MLVDCPLTAEDEEEAEESGDSLRAGGITVGRNGGAAGDCEGSVRVHVIRAEEGVVIHKIGGRRNNVVRSPG